MAYSIPKLLKTEPTPIINENIATFVWKGRTAPFLVGDFTGWEDGNPITLEKKGKGLWTFQFNFPADAYIEYGFMKDEESLSDPFNPRQTPNGVGGYNNYFSMPEYKPTDFVRHDRHISHGTVRQFSLSTDYLVTGNQRTVYLYQPPVTEQVPLVVVWDGLEYLKRVRLNHMVDNLIAQGRMRPIALVFVPNGGQVSRTFEYACNEATLAFLLSQVLPLANRELNLLDIHSQPGQYGVMGSSMGGLMALHTGARLPQVFGKVISQSGAFSIGSLDTAVYDLLERGKLRPLKIWMDVGKYDLPGLLETNRRMRTMLVERGYPLTYHEYTAGHNYPAWRDDIWRGLEVLYGIDK